MGYKILLPLDGSRESESALDYARMLASKTQVGLEMVRCFESPATVYALPDLDSLTGDVLDDHNLQSKMLQYLESKVTELHGLSCNARVLRGDPAREITKQAESADLVIMSRHGRGGLGRWLLGGVTAKVARSSSKPVLVVPGDRRAARKLERIMVCLDGSEIAEAGLQVAARLAGAVGAKLVLYRFVPLVSAVDPEGELLEARCYLQARREAYSEVVSEMLVQPGSVKNQIIECAKELDIDMLVLGSHGRHGVSRWLLGSVAEQVLHHAHCPVLIVHQQS